MQTSGLRSRYMEELNSDVKPAADVVKFFIYKYYHIPYLQYVGKNRNINRRIYMKRIHIWKCYPVTNILYVPTLVKNELVPVSII